MAALLFLSVFCVRTEALPRFDKEVVRYDSDWLVSAPTVSATLFETTTPGELVLSNGLISRTFRTKPNGATVSFDLMTTGTELLRGVKPEARVTIDGVDIDVGGLLGQPNYAFLRNEWLADMKSDPDAMQFIRWESGPIEPRMNWKRVRHAAPNVQWPPRGIHLCMTYGMPESASETLRDILVRVHYNLYDGVPVLSKWITVENTGQTSVRLDSFTCELLAAVENGSEVNNPDNLTPNIHVESDMAFCSMGAPGAIRSAAHWIPDPDFTTQVNYQLKTPCLLEASPDVGPATTIEPGGSFESFRVFELPFDSTDRERNGLAQRRMYRTIAPWVTENPLMMHVRYADWETVKNAIDQCAETGFEMVILTFGSGFDLEDDSKGNLERMRQYADYAHSKGIEI
ncbi:MAG: alpha-galactosidase, partial [Candidatus Omnitrophica bacterium]|nr:alpha-galactosidase [Candidatus Omnitrophota bacterium]